MNVPTDSGKLKDSGLRMHCPEKVRRPGMAKYVTDTETSSSLPSESSTRVVPLAQDESDLPVGAPAAASLPALSDALPVAVAVAVLLGDAAAADSLTFLRALRASSGESC